MRPCALDDFAIADPYCAPQDCRMGQRGTWQEDVIGRYARRLDVFEYRARLGDVPRDVAQLLELARDIELEDRISVDHETPSE